MTDFIGDLFKCKDLTQSSVELYKRKLLTLNDNKPIKNVNFLLEIDKIKDKIKSLKPNTQRSYIISVCSILKCFITSNKANKKIKNIYDTYSKLLENYNTDLKDQTTITTTENKNWVSPDDITKIYEELKKNYKVSKQDYQNYLLLSLFYLNPPRRNKDYQYMKVINEYKEDLSNEYNYLDLKNKQFIFNNYKTAKKYNKQTIDINEELFKIIKEYINHYKISNDDFLLTDKNDKQYTNNNAITLIFNNIFKPKKVSSSMLRKSYLTSKYGANAQELIEDVKEMGTSTQTASNNYIKKKLRP
jgi:integrase